MAKLSLEKLMKEKNKSIGQPLIIEGQSVRRKWWTKAEEEQGFRNRSLPKGWKKIRLATLRRDNWLCVICNKKNKVISAKEVDHIIPVSSGGTHEMDNLQSLCKECHALKTKRDISRQRRLKSKSTNEHIGL